MFQTLDWWSGHASHLSSPRYLFNRTPQKQQPRNQQFSNSEIGASRKTYWQQFRATTPLQRPTTSLRRRNGALQIHLLSELYALEKHSQHPNHIILNNNLCCQPPTLPTSYEANSDHPHPFEINPHYLSSKTLKHDPHHRPKMSSHHPSNAARNYNDSNSPTTCTPKAPKTIHLCFSLTTSSTGATNRWRAYMNDRRGWCRANTEPSTVWRREPGRKEEKLVQELAIPRKSHHSTPPK